MLKTKTGLEIKKVRGKGRGVFATKLYTEGAVVEVCPVITVLNNRDVRSNLNYYVYAWGKNRSALVGGCGSIYNHSNKPNAAVEMDYKTMTLTVMALRRIGSGDEIQFNYSPGYETQLGFKAKK